MFVNIYRAAKNESAGGSCFGECLGHVEVESIQELDMYLMMNFDELVYAEDDAEPGLPIEF